MNGNSKGNVKGCYVNVGMAAEGPSNGPLINTLLYFCPDYGQFIK